MKKKIISVIITLVLTLCIGSNVFAATPTIRNVFRAATSNTNVVEKIAVANLKIEQLIDKAVFQGDCLYAAYNAKLAIVSSLNPQNTKGISDLKAKYNADLDGIINQLLADTNSLSTKLIAVAADQGVTVESTYVPIVIGDRTVLVDPLRVTR